MTHSVCPFNEGDRVDHNIFGFGTVSGAPTPMVGPDLHSPGGVRDVGWSIPVRWDDPARTATAVMNAMLRKVSSPDAQPFTYWDLRWQPLRQEWLAARRDVEDALSGFRPAPTTAEVAKLQHIEKLAFDALHQFWEDERTGKHP